VHPGPCWQPPHRFTQRCLRLFQALHFSHEESEGVVSLALFRRLLE
jgi:hypothetical protein